MTTPMSDLNCKFSDSDLNTERKFWSNSEEREKPTTVHWCILHIIEHSALHTGQIFYIRKMYPDIKPYK